uniref:SGNH hydrolase-type esterase domain-containing protein n=1 Tax=Pygocentrus nattereri TaxID=42514 RepID=A0A3B4CH42_PYGNA
MSVVIIGDSIVRHLKVTCSGSKSAVGCFPGARVLDISKWFPVALGKHGNVGTVVIHTGVNDISSHQSEAFKEHLRSLLDTVKKRTKARVINLGPLPTYWRGSEMFSRLYMLHCWLQG